MKNLIFNAGMAFDLHKIDRHRKTEDNKVVVVKMTNHKNATRPCCHYTIE